MSFKLVSWIAAIVMLFIIHHVYCWDIDENDIINSFKEEENFFRFAQKVKHNNEQARHLTNVKRFLDRNGKQMDSGIYKRMKRKFLQSLKSDFLRRRAQYEEDVKILSYAACGNRIIPIEVPRLPHVLVFPDFINLHRCLGGCTFKSLDIFHCGVQKTASFNLSIDELNLQNGVYRQTQVTMVDHKKCGCQCRVQAHHCTKDTEVYDANRCECRCKDLQDRCDQVTKKWDRDFCGCKCIKGPQTCNDINKSWNPLTCKCQCRDTKKKRCQSKNKNLNENTCQCYCPNTTCREGFKFYSDDCSCTPV